MPDEPLFTLRERADQLSLPESTVRYYRDAFLDHIPSVGTGRRRRYPPAALAVLRSIAKGYSGGLSHAEILSRMDGPPAAPAAEPVAGSPKPRRRSAASETAEVTNLDLLAAIVDGEREQREALWQMAQEIVRLTGVLENQEKVLTEIGEHTGFTLGAGEPHAFLAGDLSAPPALGRGLAEAPPAASFTPAAVPAPEPPSEPRAASAPTPAWILDTSPRPASAPAAPLESAPRPSSGAADPSEIERLRHELDSERQLVDRLREAKLKLEQRTAEAEGAVEENRVRRRSSVLGRFLKADRDAP
jgi:DNA-binding transcriptional MerR regulator